MLSHEIHCLRCYLEKKMNDDREHKTVLTCRETISVLEMLVNMQEYAMSMEKAILHNKPVVLNVQVPAEALPAADGNVIHLNARRFAKSFQHQGKE